MPSKNSQAPSLVLLEHTYAVIDGIPDAQVTLQTWNTYGPLETSADTDGCVVTWLARHPDFQVPGYELVESDYDGWVHAAKSSGVAAGRQKELVNTDYICELFGLSALEGFSLLSDRNATGRYDPPDSDGLSDKQLWQARICEYLA